MMMMMMITPITQIMFRDDRARCGLLRRHQHSVLDIPGRRGVRHLWPQVVDQRRHGPQDQDLRVHGEDRHQRRQAQAAVHGAGAL